MLLALLVVGCGSNRNQSAAPELRTATAFFSNLKAGRLSEAYQLSSLALQAKFSRPGIGVHFNQGLEDAKIPRKSCEFALKIGELPKDPFEARERYLINTEPDQSTWKAWVEGTVSAEGKSTPVAVLVVQEPHRGLRIAFFRIGS